MQAYREQIVGIAEQVVPSNCRLWCGCIWGVRQLTTPKRSFLEIVVRLRQTFLASSVGTIILMQSLVNHCISQTLPKQPDRKNLSKYLFTPGVVCPIQPCERVRFLMIQRRLIIDFFCYALHNDFGEVYT